jgi:hypothetical protein
LAEVKDPVIVHDTIVVVTTAVGSGLTSIDPLKVDEAVADALTAVKE